MIDVQILMLFGSKTNLSQIKNVILFTYQVSPFPLLIIIGSTLINGVSALKLAELILLS